MKSRTSRSIRTASCISTDSLGRGTAARDTPHGLEAQAGPRGAAHSAVRMLRAHSVPSAARGAHQGVRRCGSHHGVRREGGWGQEGMLNQISRRITLPQARNVLRQGKDVGARGTGTAVRNGTQRAKGVLSLTQRSGQTNAFWSRGSSGRVAGSGAHIKPPEPSVVHGPLTMSAEQINQEKKAVRSVANGARRWIASLVAAPPHRAIKDPARRKRRCPQGRRLRRLLPIVVRHRACQKNK